MEKIYEIRILDDGRKCISKEDRLYFLKCYYKDSRDHGIVRHIFYCKIRLTYKGKYTELQKYVANYMNHWYNDELVDEFGYISKEQYDLGTEKTSCNDGLYKFLQSQKDD